MSQNSLTLPTTGTVSGLQMTQYANNAMDTLNTLASGASAPGSAEAGQLWHDTANNILKIRSLDNTTWIALFALSESSYFAAPYYNAGASGFINKFRNMCMDIAQRGTSGTITAGSPAYTLDGWIAGCTGASVAWAQTVVTANSVYNSLKLTGNTGATDSFIEQRIESLMAAQLVNNSAACTVQFLIINKTGAALAPTLTVKHATAQDNWAATVTDVSAVSLQSIANNATGVVAYSFVPNSGSGNGLEITLDFGNALDNSGNSISLLNADIRLTPGVAAGLNNLPPAPELRPAATELALCQRYYEQFKIPTWLPGTVSSQPCYSYGFKATKRAAPTMTTLSGPTYGGSASGADINATDVNSVAIQMTVVSAGDYMVNWLMSASAEL